MTASAAGFAMIAGTSLWYVRRQSSLGRTRSAPAMPLYQPHVITVFSQRVGGFCLHPVWIFDFLDYSITKWDAARRLQ